MDTQTQETRRGGKCDMHRRGYHRAHRRGLHAERDRRDRLYLEFDHHPHRTAAEQPGAAERGVPTMLALMWLL